MCISKNYSVFGLYIEEVIHRKTSALIYYQRRGFEERFPLLRYKGILNTLSFSGSCKNKFDNWPAPVTKQIKSKLKHKACFFVFGRF